MNKFQEVRGYVVKGFGDLYLRPASSVHTWTRNLNEAAVFQDVDEAKRLNASLGTSVHRATVTVTLDPEPVT